MTLQRELKHWPVLQVTVKSSPCINECKLDDTKSYCIGCRRTIEEIIHAGKQRQNNERADSRIG